MQKKWLSILLFAPLIQSNYTLADQAKGKELNYQGLGEVLFFDKSLSFNKTQSCSTCHNRVRPLWINVKIRQIKWSPRR